VPSALNRIFLIGSLFYRIAYTDSIWVSQIPCDKRRVGLKKLITSPEKKDCVKQWRNQQQNATANKRVVTTCPLCRTPIYFMITNDAWPLNKDEHNRIISRFLKSTMQIECDYFKRSVEIWQRNGFEEHQLSCPHGNWCHYGHRLPGSARQFWFSTQRIREMISERSQLRRQRESEQHLVSSDLDLWDPNDTDVAEYYPFDSANDSDSEVEDIVAADERHREAFAEIDAIADQLSSEELLRRYQEAFMREMGRRAMAERELALESAEPGEVIGPFDNRFW